MTPKHEPLADTELSGLRDFQQDTATYVFARMFGDGEDATSRFLVADEVGLGKTLVARGVIAQVIDHLKATGDKRIDIVYLASNGAIAAQNVRKLAPRGVPTINRADRLSMLPFLVGDMARRDVNVIALTPGTSVEFGSSGGMFPERAAAFAALGTIWSGHRLRGAGIARIFAGSIKGQGALSAEDRLRQKAKSFGPLPKKCQVLLTRAIRDIDKARKAEGEPTLDEDLHAIAPQYASGRVTTDGRRRRTRLIREIREAMAWTGVQLLQPDLVILDEFQRFRSLLDESGEETIGEIARALFNYDHTDFRRKTRVLLLSATPYVMHTTTAEVASGSGSHYDDFLATYRFLAGGLPDANAAQEEAALRARLARVRSSILDVEVDGVEPVRTAVDEVSAQLTRVMVRTERLASTADHNGMLTTVHDPVGVPSSSSLKQFVGAAKVASHMRGRGDVSSADVMEYWKSAPYPLSYLGGHDYMLGKAMRSRSEGIAFDRELMDLIRTSSAVLPWKDVLAYRHVDPANARLTQLWDDFFNAGSHRLLWLPPSCPYYAFAGRFDTSEARRLTKRLVFSAWALVPTAISTMTSFEVERLLHGEAKKAGAVTSNYQAMNNRRHVRHLRFAAGTQSMSTLVFVVPSPALAALGDPLVVSAAIRAAGDEPTWERIVDDVTARITEVLKPLIPSERGSGEGSAAWYTLAPMLLDRRASEATGYDPAEVQGHGVDREEPDAPSDRYLETLRAWLDLIVDGADLAAADLPPVPEDLEQVLALSALAGPPNCLLRALGRHFPEAATSDLVWWAVEASTGMMSLFNSWEATRIIDAYDSPGGFWLKALTYCAEGHLQAVLDEYMAALVEWRGFNREADRDKALRETVQDLVTVLTMRTSVYNVLAPDQQAVATESMRGRFAIRFGKGVSEEQSEQRADAVSLAFNSPFWPFVLTTTSIGQEGLDFHLYCHAVSHWNLPSNPVDLEQREGRVHRYKGHAVRKNVAAVVGPPSGEREPWAELFEKADALTASSRDTQIVPYWVFPPDEYDDPTMARIERHLPITPYSREASRFEPLMASLAYYRLAFGQPRQEELVRHVLGRIEDTAVRRALADIRVDLTPPNTRGVLR